MYTIKRTTPYPMGRKLKDKGHACYLLWINKKIDIQIDVWEFTDGYSGPSICFNPDYSVQVSPSNAVNPPAISYYKWNPECNVSRAFAGLKEVLNRDVKYATLKDLAEIKKALTATFLRIARKTKSEI